jgi:hypothetical protein
VSISYDSSGTGSGVGPSSEALLTSTSTRSNAASGGGGHPVHIIQVTHVSGHNDGTRTQPLRLHPKGFEQSALSQSLAFEAGK